MKFYKYHGLGNDYLVMDAGEIGRELSVEEIRLICHRHYGIGSDGILWGPLPTEKADFGLRIFNPDGSEAEKSGNGLRIFSRYLFDRGRVGEEPFTIDTLGGVVRSRVYEGGRMIDVEMGRATFNSAEIPVAGPVREVVDETLRVLDREFRYCAVSVGNPHCVLLLDTVSEELARTYGPHIEVEPRFPRRTNVQFMQVIDRENIRIEIWERGAGYTLASGSSSCAAAAAAVRLGLCDRKMTVHMPGGTLKVAIHEDGRIDMSGPVVRIGKGHVDDEALQQPPAKG